MMITLLNAFIERQKIPVNGDGRSHWPFPTLPLANCGCKKIASRVLKGDARLKGTLFSSSLARSRISMTSRRRGETDTRRKLDYGSKNWGMKWIGLTPCTYQPNFELIQMIPKRNLQNLNVLIFGAMFNVHYFSVPNKHPWMFNLNEIFFSTQRQLMILDI